MLRLLGIGRRGLYRMLGRYRDSATSESEGFAAKRPSPDFAESRAAARESEGFAARRASPDFVESRAAARESEGFASPARRAGFRGIARRA